MIQPSLNKRIKRRINARKHSFFVSCSPGLKRLCHREISLLRHEQDPVSMVKGGIEFNGYVHEGYLANLHLRSPSKILMRISQFKAENFRTLEKRLMDIDWDLYLFAGSTINIAVTSHQSRLYHGGAVRERMLASIQHCLKKPGQNQALEGVGHSAMLFIRITNDHAELSIDSSGDLLHKRGIKTRIGAAPLRATLAFAVLSACQYTGQEPLMDPMCGSGTFSLEAAMISRNIPPGFFRSFAFEQWPCFSQGRWNFIKKTAQEQFILPEEAEIFASDIDQSQIRDLESTLQTHNLGYGFSAFSQDFFSIRVKTLTSQKGVVVLNPPYGKRLGEKKHLFNFYTEIGMKLKSDFKGWRAGIIIPQRHLISALPFDTTLIPLFHGGLELNAAIACIK